MNWTGLDIVEDRKVFFNIVNTIKEVIAMLKRKVTHKIKSNTRKEGILLFVLLTTSFSVG